jgi:two-component system, NtrC family, sensor kinase
VGKSPLAARSISFRLYMIIVPATILAIALISYIDVRVATRLLDQEIQNKTRRIAGELAVGIANLDPAEHPDMLRNILGQIIETNFYITRIDVFRRSANTSSRIVSTTSSLDIEPIQVDEITAMNQDRPLELPVFQDRERCWKVIIPYSNHDGIVTGCVTVISSLSPSDLVIKVHDQVGLVLIPVSIAVLVLLLHFLFTRVLTGRIWRLGHAMGLARQGDLAKRAPIEHQDELGAIAGLFNETMDEIQKASEERDRLLDEQRDFNTQLQLKVHDATEGLSAANMQLIQVNRDLIDTQRRLTRYERMAIAGQMAAAFAHEVGSPLSAISTHLDLLAEDSSCNEDARRRIQLIQEQLNRIIGFVEELLSETRAAAQAFGRVQINDILEQLLVFLEQHLERQKIKISRHFQPGLPEIEANAQQLQQVFLNLLNNAADAMQDGGTILTETRTESDGDLHEFVAVSVSDNGIGIPFEEQKRIFEPFFSTKDFRGGTGLGLSIAARIVRQHEGTISVKSAPGEGTTFIIRFPVQPAKPEFPEKVRGT